MVHKSDRGTGSSSQLLNKELLADLHRQAADSERLRMNYDLRTSGDDTSQRMLNALQPGTRVPIHRHLQTSETVIVQHLTVADSIDEQILRALQAKDRTQAALIAAVKADLKI